MAERFNPALHHFSRPLATGKTKDIWGGPWMWNKAVAVESKDVITAEDGERVNEFPGKAAIATETAQNLFYYLKRHGVENHFEAPINATHFLARQLKMIPVEVVVRRFAEGSYLERNPKVEPGSRFRTPVVEFFLKDKARHDPLILRDENSSGSWVLHDPHKPVGDQPLGRINPIKGAMVNRNNKRIVDTTLEAFRALEWGLDQLGHDVVDVKFECGVFEGEELMIGDVVDNDSWRLRLDKIPGNDPSKQRYRDGVKGLHPLAPLPKGLAEHVNEGYTIALDLTRDLLTKVPLPPYKSPFAYGELITDYPLINGETVNLS